MNKRNIKCLCGNEYNETTFKTHFKNCEIYKNNFKELDILINKYLKIYDSLLVRFLLKRYIKLIESKVTKNPENKIYLSPNIKKIDYNIKIIGLNEEKTNKNINIIMHI